MRAFTISLLISLVTLGSAAFGQDQTHALAGDWQQGDYYFNVSDDGSFSTNVRTQDGFEQVFTEKLRYYSTSPTSGFYTAMGYFRYTHGNFPYQVTCHHAVRVDAYLDQNTGDLVANFLTPQGIWAVWQPDGGHCHEQGVVRRQGIFAPVAL